jgi:hypothetical protein
VSRISGSLRSGKECGGLIVLVFGSKCMVILTIEGACWLDISAILWAITGVLINE